MTNRTKRRTRMLGLCCALALLTSVSFTSSAWATTKCDPLGTNLYAMGCIFTASGYFAGLQANITAHHLKATNNGSHAITAIYVVNSNTGNDIEAGMFRGTMCNGPCDTSGSWNAASHIRFYTTVIKSSGEADYPDTDSGGIATAGTSYLFYISKVDGASETWEAFAGPWSRTITGDPLTPELDRTGLEIGTSPQDTAPACAGQSNIEWEDGNYGWHSGLTNSAYPNGLLGQNNRASPDVHGAWQDSARTWLRDWTPNSEYTTCWGS